MTNIVHLPTAAPPPPEDARPIGRERMVLVYPERAGTWAVMACDDGGAAMLGSDLDKWDAIQIGLNFVRRWNAEMTIQNAEFR